MIALLRGVLVEKRPNQVIVEAGGVEYDVTIPACVFNRLPEPGAEVRLRVHVRVRDGAVTLYGFLTQEEKARFERLIGMSGIGPGMAMKILSGLEAPDLIGAGRRDEVDWLARLPVRIRKPLRAAIPWICLCVLAATGVLICRKAFLTQYTGHFGSMHGEWLAMARIVGLDWFRPRWWPYWGGGAPIQYAYAPLVPAAIAALVRLAHCTPAMALNVLTGLVYCLAPLTLYFATWRLTRAPGYSFFSALAYLVAFPPENVDAASGFGLAWFVTTRRAYRLFEWDDLPHLMCLTLLPLAVWLLARALQKRRPLDYALAAAAFAGMMAASMFGLVLTAIAAVAVAPALGGRRWRPVLLRASLVVVAGYLLACPWQPPSLLLTVRRVAAANGESDWSARGFLALAILLLAWAAVQRASARYIREWPVRWMTLFACPAVLIPALDHYLKLHFLPQSYRYQAEMEMSLCLLIVFALRPLVGRLPIRARALLAVSLVVLAVGPLEAQRKFLASMMTPVDVARSIEYRSAKWFEANMPNKRVMPVGSIAAWLNAFTNVPQMSGQSYSTAPNPVQQAAHWAIMSAPGTGGEAPYAILCLKAYGVQAVEAPGPQSPEYWKPFANPRKFEGVLTVLWREDDTAIYRVPQASASLAHVMRLDQVSPRQSSNGVDADKVGRYVAALDNPDALASFTWRGPNVADIQADLPPGDVVSVQVTFDPGWRAFVNGSPRAVQRDGLGLMFIDPACSGACDIRLVYDGGWEARLCRAAMIAVVLFFVGWAIVRRRPSAARR
ncbi:MAG: Holliday junction branch migration protein RuvA [Bryobacteraceae bacterium]|jgi:hypothetical protein